VETQVVPQLGRPRIARGGVESQAFRQHVAQADRNLGIAAHQLAAKVGREQRPFARERFKKDHAQGEQIGATVHVRRQRFALQHRLQRRPLFERLVSRRPTEGRGQFAPRGER
jgi:hypothetical protein